MNLYRAGTELLWSANLRPRLDPQRKQALLHKAAVPQTAIPLYDLLPPAVEHRSPVQTGVFGAEWTGTTAPVALSLTVKYE